MGELPLVEPDRLYISRSALTQQMKQLEKELGFTIFERGHTGVALTREGAYLVERLQKMKADYEETVRYCREQRQPPRGNGRDRADAQPEIAFSLRCVQGVSETASPCGDPV